MIKEYINCPNCGNKVPSEWATSSWICPSCQYIIPSEGTNNVPVWFAKQHPKNKIYIENSASNSINLNQIMRNPTFLDFSTDTTSRTKQKSAEELIKEQKYEEALLDLNSRIAMDNSNVGLRYQRAFCIYSVDNPDEELLAIAEGDMIFLDKISYAKHLSKSIRKLNEFSSMNKDVINSVNELTGEIKNTVNKCDLKEIFNLHRMFILEKIAAFFSKAEECHINNIITPDSFINCKSQLNNLLDEIDKTASDLSLENNISFCLNHETGTKKERENLIKIIQRINK